MNILITKYLGYIAMGVIRIKNHVIIKKDLVLHLINLNFAHQYAHFYS